MAISAGIVGAFIAGIIGAVSAFLVLQFVGARMRDLDKSQTPQERETFERKMTAMWWIIVTADTLAFAAVGYWLGQLVGG